MSYARHDRDVYVVRTAHWLVQQADYLCQRGHVWQTRWTVA